MQIKFFNMGLQNFEGEMFYFNLESIGEKENQGHYSIENGQALDVHIGTMEDNIDYDEISKW